MEYLVLLMMFKNENRAKKTFKSIKTTFQGSYEKVYIVPTEDNLHTLFVITSERPLDSELVRVFKIYKRAEIVYSYSTTTSPQNLFVAAVIHQYSNWERLNTAPIDREKAKKNLSKPEYSERVRFSEFQSTHSIVVLEQLEAVSLMEAAVILSVIRPSKKHLALIFNSSSVQQFNN